MFNLATRPAFEGLIAPGRYGKADGEAGVIAAERDGLGLASIEARKDALPALHAAVETAYGAMLPEGPSLARGREVNFIGTGPGQWLAVSEPMANERLAEDLQSTLKEFASISDQSSGRAVLRLEGPKVRDCLAKGLAIDLDPRVFLDGSAATSAISHMGALLWRQGEAYNISVFRSFAGSFWHWLEASAAEYGLETVSTS